MHLFTTLPADVKKIILTFFAFFALIFWFTSGVTQTFFQQDEWNGFGLVLQLQEGSWLDWFGLLSPSHFIPLSQFVWFVMYRLFGFEAQYYALAGLVLHAISCVLIVRLGEIMTKNRWIGLLTGILFATNFRAAQAFTHMAIFPATLTGYIVIISFLLYLFTIDGKKLFHRTHAFVLSGLFLFSMLFREDGLILPVLLLGYLAFFQPKAFSKKNLWFFIIFFGVVAAFVLFRVSLQLTNPHAIGITGSGALKTIVYNAVSLPVKLVVQNIFEGIQLFNLFWANKARFYPEYHHQITTGLMYTVVYDFVMLTVGVLLACLYGIFSLGKKYEKYWHIVGFSLLWIVVSAGLLSVVGRAHNVVESRYLYLTSFPVLLMLAQLFVHLWSLRTSRVVRLIARVAVITVVVIFTWWSYRDMQITIARYKKQSAARMSLLASLLKLYPTIPQRSIFYVECGGVCVKNIDLVGVPNEYVLPFTSGPGWIFMLQYARADEKAFAPFFSRLDGKEFLWDLGVQGYRQIDNRGFGYFVDKKLLLETLRDRKLDPSVVIALAYDEESHSFRDISPSVQQEMQRQLGYTTKE